MGKHLRNNLNSKKLTRELMDTKEMVQRSSTFIFFGHKKTLLEPNHLFEIELTTPHR